MKRADVVLYGRLELPRSWTKDRSCCELAGLALNMSSPDSRSLVERQQKNASSGQDCAAPNYSQTRVENFSRCWSFLLEFPCSSHMAGDRPPQVGYYDQLDWNPNSHSTLDIAGA